MSDKGYNEAKQMINYYGWDEAACYYEECAEMYSKEITDSRWCNEDFRKGFVKALDEALA